MPIKPTSLIGFFFDCFHLYTLNAKPRMVAEALIDPVIIPTIEPVDNLEDVDDADAEVPEDVAERPLVVFDSQSLVFHRI